MPARNENENGLEWHVHTTVQTGEMIRRIVLKVVWYSSTIPQGYVGCINKPALPVNWAKQRPPLLAESDKDIIYNH